MLSSENTNLTQVTPHINVLTEVLCLKQPFSENLMEHKNISLEPRPNERNTECTQ